jgi:hypothetical protein
MPKIMRDSEFEQLERDRIELQEKLDQALNDIDEAASEAETAEEFSALVESALEQINQRLDYLTWQPIVENRSDLAELPMEERRKLIRIARQFWVKDPLMHQAVSLTTNYTFGEGLRHSSNLEDVTAEVDSFWTDEDNQLELTAYQAQEQKSNELQVDGEIFFVLFVDEDYRVKVRTLPPEEITEIICSPDDHRRPLYYERKHAPVTYDMTRKNWKTGATQTTYYADWRNYAPGKWGEFDRGVELQEGLIYHVALNRISWQKRGYTEMYPALDWAKAHRQLLQDWVTIVKAYSTLAWKAKITGDDPRDFERIRSRIKAMMPSFTGQQGESWAPSGTAGVQVENDDVTLQPIKTAGMATSPSDAREIRLMAGAGMGIMEHYFGDAGNANLATATAMELPMLKKFAARQRLWESVYTNILGYVIQKGIEAGRIDSVELTEHTDSSGRIVSRRLISEDRGPVVSVKAPPILRADLKQVSDSMKTLTEAGLIPIREASRYAMNAMDLPNTEAILAQLEKEGADQIPAADLPPVELDGQPQPASSASQPDEGTSSLPQDAPARLTPGLPNPPPPTPGR